MDGWLKKLQEVADLPQQAESEARADPSPTADRSPAEDADLEKVGRAELIELVQASRATAGKWEKECTVLRDEARSIGDEFAAYKTKVQSWREQIKNARAQDRKTIETLRQAQQQLEAGESGASGERKTSDSDPYITSLEEQVKSLKETIRDQAEVRDALALENGRLKDRAREIQHRQQDDLQPEVQTLVSDLQEELKCAQTQINRLEDTNERLLREVEDATTQLSKTAAENVATRDKKMQAQEKYLKDLESELAAYRKHAAKAETVSTEATSPSHRAGNEGGGEESEESYTPSTTAAQVASLELLNKNTELTRTNEMLSKKVNQLEVSLRAAHDETERTQNRLAAIQLESTSKDDVLTSFMTEAQTAREELEIAKEQLQLRTEDVRRAKEERQRLEDDILDANQRAQHAADALHLTQNQVAKLQRENCEKSEALRKAKLEELKREQARLNSHSVRDANFPATSGASAGAASTAIPVASPVNEPPSLTTRIETFKSAYRQYALEYSWVWSSSKYRTYAVAAIVCFFILIFSFYQSTNIVEDSTNVDLLRRCKALMGGK